MSALAAIVFIAVVFPLLFLAERIKGYLELATERKHGKIRSSLVIVFGMFAEMICICWGGSMNGGLFSRVYTHGIR